MFQVEINDKKNVDSVDVENIFSADLIIPKLYLGNVTAAQTINFLKEKGISHILTIDRYFK